MNHSLPASLLRVSITSLAVCGAANGQVFYDIRGTGDLAGGPRLSQARAITNDGTVLVSGAGPFGESRGFLWNDGLATQIAVPRSFVSGLNSHGAVVGHSAAGQTHGFLWTNGVESPTGTFFPRRINDHGTMIGVLEDSTAAMLHDGIVSPFTPEHPSTTVSAINSAGTAAGSVRVGVSRPAIWQEGVLSVLALPVGWGSGGAVDINDLGHVLVARGDGGGSDFAIWREGDYEVVARSQLSATQVAAINNRDEVVGRLVDPNESGSFPYRAFVWRHECGVVVLNDAVDFYAGWQLHEATDINDSGVIVGAGLGPDDCYADCTDGYVLIPRHIVADWNDNLCVDSQDFFDFLEGFFVGSADANGDQITDSQDYFDFLECFFGACLD